MNDENEIEDETAAQEDSGTQAEYFEPEAQAETPAAQVEPEPEPESETQVETPEPELEVDLAFSYTPAPIPDLFTSEEDEQSLRRLHEEDPFAAMVAVQERIVARDMTAYNNSNVAQMAFAQEAPEVYRIYGQGITKNLANFDRKMRGTKEGVIAAMFYTVAEQAVKGDVKTEVKRLYQTFCGKDAVTAKPAAKSAPAPATAKQTPATRTPAATATAAPRLERAPASTRGLQEGASTLMELYPGLTREEILAIDRDTRR